MRDILIKGARANNLQNIDVCIPRNKLVVITGVSGSGKSTLAFDTLFAEGHHMYIESLNTYARQFLKKIDKPDVDYIQGISPTIAIEQKTNTNNPRSTVGTMTEIYDYIKMIYARIGKIYSPISGHEVKKHTVEDIVEYLKNLEKGTKINVLCPVTDNPLVSQEDILNKFNKGFTRVIYKGDVFFIEDFLKRDLGDISNSDIYLVIDRIVSEQANESRVLDSIQICLSESDGICIIDIGTEKKIEFSNKLELDGMIFTQPSLNFFSFNSSYGACPKCNGYGDILGIDENKVIPDQKLSLEEDAILIYSYYSARDWKENVLKACNKLKIPVNAPYKDLSTQQKNMLWEGYGELDGINEFFKKLESQAYKVQNRVMISRYRSKILCKNCRGTRLRPDAAYVKIGGKSIVDTLTMPISEVRDWFDNLILTSYENKICKVLLQEIRSRLLYLVNVGLGYLTLGRGTPSLSGGEYQRIKLATSLGSTLVDAIYILDEPTIGLHAKDTKALVETIKKLKNMGSTVVVVEHEAEMMQAADQIIDIGPDAGYKGGHVTFQGTFEQLKNADTHTAEYLSGKKCIPIPEHRRAWNQSITITGANENNLKNLTVTVPLNAFTCITGVSGSGKSTLVKKVIVPLIEQYLNLDNQDLVHYDKISGNLETIKNIELIDQNSITKSSRSNPITYVKAYDFIRQIMATQDLSIQRGYSPSYFSFNIDGGRCPDCNGDGKTKLEMQFMADAYLICESCNGNRFKEEILEVKFNGKNILEILDLTVDEAIEFFANHNLLATKLKVLQVVGLGYLRLGQPCSNLSGGEAQRLKLASYMGKEKENSHTLFIFDEPTTGLHFADINKLVKAIQSLIDRGNSAIVIEHNLDLVKCADWIIDLGPEGGNAGGHITFAGLPEDMVKMQNNHTADFLKSKL
jgi:excinuclease ABC subunit A